MATMVRKVDRAFVQDNLASGISRQYLLPVNFCYDYLHGGISYLKPPPLKVNEYSRLKTFLKLAESKEPNGGTAANGRSDNGIDFDPLAAGLPWTTGLLACRQSKHWRLSLDTTKSFLEALAASDWTGIVSKSGKSIAEISQKELASDVEEGWAKFPIYFFPDGDEQRTRLLAVMNVFVYVLDEFWEMHDIACFSGVQQAIISRLQGTSHSDGPKTVIESMIDEAITEILELDEKNGTNSGKGMIEALVRFFGRPPPAEKYNTMDEYLRYREEDAAAPYILACTKFSINSSVDLDSPRLARYVRLLADQISIANDISSWDKEKKHYDSGEVLYLINTVNVTKQLFGLPTWEAAVAITQALQFQTERDLDKEIQRLVEEDSLTAEEWRFIDATLPLIAGNVMCSIVMSRYGGERLE